MTCSVGVEGLIGSVSAADSGSVEMAFESCEGEALRFLDEVEMDGLVTLLERAPKARVCWA